MPCRDASAILAASRIQLPIAICSVTQLMSLPMAIGPRAAVVFALQLVCGWCFFVDITSDVASFDLDRHPFREVGRASS